VFDEEAGVFDGEEAGGAGGFASGGVDDAELEPDSFGMDGDGGVDDGRDLFGAAEDVDDVDGAGDVFEAGIGFLAEHFPFVGIDGNDAIANVLEVGSNFVAGTGGVGRKADNGDGFGEAEKVEDGIGERGEVIGEVEFHRCWMKSVVEWLW
jgi:hypothetical protein